MSQTISLKQLAVTAGRRMRGKTQEETFIETFSKAWYRLVDDLELAPG